MENHKGKGLKWKARASIWLVLSSSEISGTVNKRLLYEKPELQKEQALFVSIHFIKGHLNYK
jgi:hypothetical protein